MFSDDAFQLISMLKSSDPLDQQEKITAQLIQLILELSKHLSFALLNLH